MSLPTEAEIDAAIRRIALTHDGMLLYRRLQMVLMDVSPVSANVGTLPRLEGRRSFARELKVLMDQELAKAPPTRDRSEHDPDFPAVSRQPEPVVATGSGPRRRVEPYPGDD